MALTVYFISTEKKEKNLLSPWILINGIKVF